MYSEHSHIEEVNSTDGLMNQTMISLSREITWTNSVNVLGNIKSSDQWCIIPLTRLLRAKPNYSRFTPIIYPEKNNDKIWRRHEQLLINP